MAREIPVGGAPGRRHAAPPGDGEPEPVKPRRSPVQARSAGTVRKIEEATSMLLAQGVSVEAMTTAQIAAAARVSVGALYQFFPDKQAIVDALAVRRIGEFQQSLAHVIAANASGGGPALVSRVIDAFVAFLDAHPDFATVAYGGRHISRGTRESQSDADVGIAALVKTYMTQTLGLRAAPQLDLRLRIAAEVGDRLIGLALEQKTREERQLIIEQLKQIVSTYLFAD